MMFDTSACTPKSEIDSRIAQFQRYLENTGTAAALILQNVDFFYFSGTLQQGYLYIPVTGDPLLMVRKDTLRARAESPITRQVPIRSPRQIPEMLAGQGYPIPPSLGLELDVLPANLYLGLSDVFAGVEITDASQAIRRQRAVKSDYELGIIREAAKLADQVTGCVPGILEKGITEIEMAGRLEAEARRLGHQGIVRMRLWGGELFYGHLMAGASAAVPSYMSSPTGGSSLSPAVAQGSSFRKIQEGEPVLVDYTFAHNGYIADHARIFAVGGLADDLLRAHETMLELQERLKREIRPGVSPGSIYSAALEWTEEKGYGEYFMGHGRERVRFVGHGVGLELDELPILAQGQEWAVQENMIVALEPKLIFPERGVVGIENTHRVTSAGLEQLTRSPESITIV
ncbi:Xaa-Pro aminopeptidase (EC [Olavius algarvensis associated proteobacterium Delta 3]|nr:Xaa-Pro aminopeptidase (EC [Olavius algarvensis associated proteobacterium Delta 3]CAB5133592.1 Xaa-Pro aminopeptidase (EC [Olavius algarvensis associated proteobacterium Delta 3]